MIPWPVSSTVTRTMNDRIPKVVIFTNNDVVHTADAIGHSIIVPTSTTVASTRVVVSAVISTVISTYVIHAAAVVLMRTVDTSSRAVWNNVTRSADTAVGITRAPDSSVGIVRPMHVVAIFLFKIFHVVVALTSLHFVKDFGLLKTVSTLLFLSRVYR